MLQGVSLKCMTLHRFDDLRFLDFAARKEYRRVLGLDAAFSVTAAVVSVRIGARIRRRRHSILGFVVVVVAASAAAAAKKTQQTARETGKFTLEPSAEWRTVEKGEWQRQKYNEYNEDF